MDDRMPPFDEAVEQQILGGIMRDPEVLDEAMQNLDPEDFYIDRHGKLFALMGMLRNKGVPVEMRMIYEHSRRAGISEDIGGAPYLASLYDAVATGVNVRYHASIIREHSLARKLINTLTGALRDVYDRIAPAEELLGTIEQKLFDLGVRRTSNAMTHISKSIREVLEQIDARIEGGGSVGISTGYADLDQITGGFHDGQLTVVAARPAQGKSALGLNLLRNIASRGVPAAFYSLEMSNIETAARGLAIDTGVSLSTINRFRPSEDQVNRLLESAQSGLGAAPLLLNDTPGLTLSMLASSLRHAIRKHGVKIAFVDYLQLITPDRNSGRSRVEQVGALSRGLKLLAGECKIPIVCMAQLNRGVEQRAGDRPKLSDLRESGSIEQDANNVWLLHPDPEADLNSPFVKVEVILAKQRNGPTGIVELNFARAHTRFENLQQG